MINYKSLNVNSYLKCKKESLCVFHSFEEEVIMQTLGILLGGNIGFLGRI